MDCNIKKFERKVELFFIDIYLLYSGYVLVLNMILIFIIIKLYFFVFIIIVYISENRIKICLWFMVILKLRKV